MKDSQIPRPDWSAIEFAVLDMDGTLLDLHFDNQVWNVLLPRRYGEKHRVDEAVARTTIARRLGEHRGTLPWYCLDHWTATLDIEIGALEEELEELIGVRPGALDFLEWLGRLDLTVILATNAHPRSLQRKLERTGIGAFFDVVLSAHEVGCSKEDLRFWSGLSRRTGLEPARTLLIDDNHAVLRAAREHGVAHLYGVAQPDSRGAAIDGHEFPCLPSFTSIIGDDDVTWRSPADRAQR